MDRYVCIRQKLYFVSSVISLFPAFNHTTSNYTHTHATQNGINTLKGISRHCHSSDGVHHFVKYTVYLVQCTLDMVFRILDKSTFNNASKVYKFGKGWENIGINFLLKEFIISFEYRHVTISLMKKFKFYLTLISKNFYQFCLVDISPSCHQFMK